MTDLTKPDHDLAETQVYIDQYAAEKATWDNPLEAYTEAHAKINAAEAGVRAEAASMRAAIDQGEKGLLGDLARRRSGLEWNCKEEARRLVATMIEGKKSRHVKTMHGMVGFKKKPATKKLNVFNEQALIDQHPEFVKMAKELDKASLKQALEGGLRMTDMAVLDETPEQDVFYVNTGKAPELPAAPPQAALPEQKGSEV